MGRYGTIFLKQLRRSPLKVLRQNKKGDSASRPYKFLLTQKRFEIRSVYILLFSLIHTWHHHFQKSFSCACKPSTYMKLTQNNWPVIDAGS